MSKPSTHLEMPIPLMQDAFSALVPYLAKSRQDQTNSFESCDYTREFIEALANEIELGDLMCDHSVGICCCSAQAALEELRLRLAGQRYCPTCGGDGIVWEAGTDTESKCPTCDGTGRVQLQEG